MLFFFHLAGACDALAVEALRLRHHPPQEEGWGPTWGWGREGGRIAEENEGGGGFRNAAYDSSPVGGGGAGEGQRC